MQTRLQSDDAAAPALACHSIRLMRPLPLLLPLLLAGCGGIQSAFTANGPDAAAVLHLTWILFIGGGAILALVVALTAYAVIAAPERRRWLSSPGFVIGGGIVFPVVTLSVLLVYGLLLTGRGGASNTAPLRIEITGEQYWWRVRYAAEGDRPAFETANEIHIPAGRPVELTLNSADVIHSFWVPHLGGKLDMIPGQSNRLMLTASEPGTARGQCAEFCGAQHASMALNAVTLPPTAFGDWRARQQGSALAPSAPDAVAGQDIFRSAGCGACHSVRGTEAIGVIGPDLTRIGSRQTLGAGLSVNTRAAMAAWIAGSQHLKPGNKMPSFDFLDAAQLNALAAYLEGLK